MFDTTRKTIATVAILAAAALGGSALANAATSGSTSGSSSSTTAAAQPSGTPPGGGPGRAAGGHVGANGKTETLLTGATAAKVKAAALAKIPGGTVERVETDVDHGSPYEAHVTKSDGTQVEVLINASFEVTAVNEMRQP